MVFKTTFQVLKMSFRITNILKEKDSVNHSEKEKEKDEPPVNIEIDLISKRIDEIQNKLKLETSTIKPELDSIVYDPNLGRWKLKKGN